MTVLFVATLAVFYWLPEHSGRALNAFTAVLIIACPCALALSTPFTLGNVLRIFGRNGFYLKNTEVIESLARVTKIVFDKTGTLTRSERSRLNFIPAAGERSRLTPQERALITTLTSQSAHPLSRYITDHIKSENRLKIQDLNEVPGHGISAEVGGIKIKIGSYDHIGQKSGATSADSASQVFISINGRYRGYFSISTHYRAGLNHLLRQLQTRYETALLTGDNEKERENLQRMFGGTTDIHFRQSPFDKLAYIQSQHVKGQRILMIGDGLNDAGALRESDIGISLSEDIHQLFTGL